MLLIMGTWNHKVRFLVSTRAQSSALFPSLFLYYYYYLSYTSSWKSQSHLRCQGSPECQPVPGFHPQILSWAPNANFKVYLSASPWYTTNSSNAKDRKLNSSSPSFPPTSDPVPLFWVMSLWCTQIPNCIWSSPLSHTPSSAKPNLNIALTFIPTCLSPRSPSAAFT